MTRIYGDVYKHSLRAATQNETVLVSSVVNELKTRSNEKTRAGVIYTIFGAIAIFVIILATVSFVADWFTAFLCVAYVGMVAYWAYDLINEFRTNTASINDIVNGNYLVANGIADDCETIRISTCASGYIGDNIKTRIEFDISSDFVDKNESTREFLLLTNHKNAYVIATINDQVLVTDDVVIYDSSIETQNN